MGVTFRELPVGRSRWRLPQSRDRGLHGNTHCGYCVHGSHLLPTDHDRRHASTPATRYATGIMPVAVPLANAPPTATPSSVMSRSWHELVSVGWPVVSTPRTLVLPDGVARVKVETPRGTFAALEAVPATGVAERWPALLIPGYTGSKEDFLPILGPLAAAGRRVLAIDMRGQYETPPAADADGYGLTALAADIALVVDAPGWLDTAPGRGERHVHLLGHSFGGLVAREIALAGTSMIGSLTLMSSGPGALTGPRAAILRAILAELDGTAPDDLGAEVKRLWDTHLEPAAITDGTPADVIEFLRTRMLRSCPTGLRSMGRGLLACPDRTPELAGLGAPLLVVYGENDDAWEPAVQDDMARRLEAQRVCIPGAGHSPAVEAPETAASILTSFWNSAETRRR